MFENIEQLEKEIQAFRQNILASSELVKSMAVFALMASSFTLFCALLKAFLILFMKLPHTFF